MPLRREQGQSVGTDISPTTGYLRDKQQCEQNVLDNFNEFFNNASALSSGSPRGGSQIHRLMKFLIIKNKCPLDPH